MADRSNAHTPSQASLVDGGPRGRHYAAAWLGAPHPAEVPGRVSHRSVLRADWHHVCADGCLRRRAEVFRAEPVAGRRAARVRRSDRLGDRLHHQRRLQLFLFALHASDHCREHDSIAARRPDGRLPEFVALYRTGARAVPRQRVAARRARLRAAAAVPDGRLHGRAECVRLPGRRAAERLPRGERAPRRRTTRRDLQSARRPAGVQPAHHRQLDERTGDDGHRRECAHVQSRGGDDYRDQADDAARPLDRGRAADARRSGQTKCSGLAKDGRDCRGSRSRTRAAVMERSSSV